MPDVLSRWFLTDAIPIELCLSYHHEAWLVVLSYVVAAFASYTAFHVVERVRSATSIPVRRIWLSLAGVAMGCGIFAMHFIAMLAVRGPIYFRFDVAVTLLSAVFAIAASGTAFHFVDGSDRSRIRLAIGAVILGAGIGLMHYTGMAALRMPARIYYDPTLFALSVVVAVALSACALSVLRASAGWTGWPNARHAGVRVGGAALMGLAITLMHYTGMFATYFYPDPAAGMDGITLDPTLMAITIGAVTFLVGGFAIVATLLDHRAAAAEAVRAETAGFLQTVIDNSGDGILTLDSGCVTRTCNPAAGRIFGRETGNLIGMSFDALIGAESSFGTDRSVGEAVRQVDIVRGDGERCVVAYTVNHMQFDGTDHFVVVVRDVSKQRMTERLLEEARQAAEEANQAKSDFLATMSHEIRTPLNGVLGMANVLLRTKLNQDQHKQVETILASGTVLLTILNDILDYSKLEAGKLTLEDSAFDLGSIVASVVDLMWVQASAKGVALSYCLAPGTAGRFVGDAGRLLQVLLNLVSNAVKFTPEGGVMVRIRAEDLPDGRVELTMDVVDTGIGLTDEAQRRLFEKFAQGDATTTRKYGGSGLGLAISSHIVELMGGTIDVESVVGEGSTFRVSLTLPRVPDGRPVTEPRFGGADIRPLVVIDNPILRQAVVEQLGLWDVHADATNDIDRARENLTTGQYNVVLSDRELRVPAEGIGCILLTDGDAGDRRDGPQGPDVDRTLRLPLHVPDLYDAVAGIAARAERYPQSEETGIAEESAVAMRPLRILVVDDNHVNQLIAQAMLATGGHTIDVASNGIEAVMMAGKSRYDAILMDIQMPEMNGVEATQRIRALSGPVARTPIIAMTANAMKGAREEYLAAGMDDYVSKPVHPKQLALALGRQTGESVDVTGIAASGDRGAPSGKLEQEDVLAVIAELDNVLDELDAG